MSLPLVNPNSTCPRCKQSLHCDIAAGASSCWCFDLPKLPEASTQEFKGQGCLCESCVKQLLEQVETTAPSK